MQIMSKPYTATISPGIDVLARNMDEQQFVDIISHLLCRQLCQRESKKEIKGFSRKGLVMKKQVKKNNAGKNERRFGVILTPFLKEPLEKKNGKTRGGGRALSRPPLYSEY